MRKLLICNLMCFTLVALPTYGSELNSFTIGSTKEEVIIVQGIPDDFNFLESEYRYGESSVTFDKDDKVESWNLSTPDPLRAIEPESKMYKDKFTIGSTKSEVILIQGIPSPYDPSSNIFQYGSSSVYFDENNRVISWLSSGSDPLKVYLPENADSLMIQRTEIVNLTALYYHGLNAYSQTGLNNNYDVEQSHAAYSVNSGRYESKSSSNGILNRVFYTLFYPYYGRSYRYYSYYPKPYIYDYVYCPSYRGYLSDYNYYSYRYNPYISVHRRSNDKIVMNHDNIDTSQVISTEKPVATLPSRRIVNEWGSQNEAPKKFENRRVSIAKPVTTAPSKPVAKVTSPTKWYAWGSQNEAPAKFENRKGSIAKPVTTVTARSNGYVRAGPNTAPVKAVNRTYNTQPVTKAPTRTQWYNWGPQNEAPAKGVNRNISN